MATWNPDNVVLTQKGSEVLSKVQAGVGKLTVSRVVSGGGYVSPAQLFRQTAVTTPMQELTITKTITDEQGSELALVLSNADLTTEYDLFQLGIYVTHPDFVGEVLYVIAQCNTDRPDHIPLPSVTVATMSYSMYMEHSGTAQVEITIDPAGQLTVGDLDIPGGIPSISPVTGKLNPSVVPGDMNYFATCATAVGTAAKVVVVSDTSFDYTTGKRIVVLFTNGLWNTTNPSTVTLNANSLGAKAVTGFDNPSTLKLNKANCLVAFVYNGTQFVFEGLEVISATALAAGVVKIADIITGSASDTALSQAAGAALKVEYNKKLGWVTAAQATVSAFIATLSGPVVTLASFSDGPVTTACVYKVYTNGTAFYAEVFDTVNFKNFFKYGATQSAFNSASWTELKSGGGGVKYASCATAAGTAAKVVTVTEFTADSLVAGFTLAMTMTNANTAASPTLNISSTGAKAITDKLATALNATTANLLSGTVLLVYDGTRFLLVSVSMASATSFGAVKLSDSVSSTSGESAGVAATPAAVKTANDNALAAGKKVVYYGTCATAAATGAKVVVCADFALEVGIRLSVKFANANTASVVTMAVNGTTALTVIDENNVALSATSAALLTGTVIFVYDGTSWVVQERVANSTTPGTVKLYAGVDSTAGVNDGVAATPSAVKTAYDLANGKQANIDAGTTDQYYRGDKAWADFASAVRVILLTGYALGDNAALAATDSLLAALGKIQAQLNVKSPLANPAFTGTPTAPTAGAGTNNTQIATTAFATTVANSAAGSKAVKVLYTATLTTTWTAQSTGWAQTVSVAGILASDTPVIGIVQTGTVATDQTLLENWALVSRITTAANSITAFAYGDKPTVALPIQILCVR